MVGIKKEKKIKKLTKVCGKCNLLLPNWHLLNTTLFTLTIKEFFYFIFWNFLYTMICFRFFSYSNRYQSIDIYCFISTIGFYIMFFSLFLTGKIKAFYRNDYDSFLKKFISFFTCFYNGALFRLIFLISQNKFTLCKNVLFSSKSFLVILFLNVFFLYILFYSDFNVSFEDFSTLTLTKFKILKTTDILIIEDDIYNILYNEKEELKNTTNKKEKKEKKKQNKEINVNDFKLSEEKEKEYTKKYIDTYKSSYQEIISDKKVINISFDNNQTIQKTNNKTNKVIQFPNK